MSWIVGRERGYMEGKKPGRRQACDCALMNAPIKALYAVSLVVLAQVICDSLIMKNQSENLHRGAEQQVLCLENNMHHRHKSINLFTHFKEWKSF